MASTAPVVVGPAIVVVGAPAWTVVLVGLAGALVVVDGEEGEVPVVVDVDGADAVTVTYTAGCSEPSAPIQRTVSPLEYVWFTARLARPAPPVRAVKLNVSSAGVGPAPASFVHSRRVLPSRAFWVMTHRHGGAPSQATPDQSAGR